MVELRAALGHTSELYLWLLVAGADSSDFPYFSACREIAGACRTSLEATSGFHELDYVAGAASEAP